MPRSTAARTSAIICVPVRGRATVIIHAHAAKADGRDFEAALSKLACSFIVSRPWSSITVGYCASLTCSIQSRASRRASPGWRYGSWPSWPWRRASASRPARTRRCRPAGSPRPTRPRAAPSRTRTVTIRVWPKGWVCQAVRAPGSKVTRAMATRAGSGGLNSGSIRTVPVKYASGPLPEGWEPAALDLHRRSPSLIDPRDRISGLTFTRIVAKPCATIERHHVDPQPSAENGRFSKCPLRKRAYAAPAFQGASLSYGAQMARLT